MAELRVLGVEPRDDVKATGELGGDTLGVSSGSSTVAI